MAHILKIGDKLGINMNGLGITPRYEVMSAFDNVLTVDEVTGEITTIIPGDAIVFVRDNATDEIRYRIIVIVLEAQRFNALGNLPKKASLPGLAGEIVYLAAPIGAVSSSARAWITADLVDQSDPQDITTANYNFTIHWEGVNAEDFSTPGHVPTAMEIWGNDREDNYYLDTWPILVPVSESGSYTFTPTTTDYEGQTKAGHWLFFLDFAVAALDGNGNVIYNESGNPTVSSWPGELVSEELNVGDLSMIPPSDGVNMSNIVFSNFDENAGTFDMAFDYQTSLDAKTYTLYRGRDVNFNSNFNYSTEADHTEVIFSGTDYDPYQEIRHVQLTGLPHDFSVGGPYGFAVIPANEAGAYNFASPAYYGAFPPPVIVATNTAPGELTVTWSGVSTNVIKDGIPATQLEVEVQCNGVGARNIDLSLTSSGTHVFNRLADGTWLPFISYLDADHSFIQAAFVTGVAVASGYEAASQMQFTLTDAGNPSSPGYNNPELIYVQTVADYYKDPAITSHYFVIEVTRLSDNTVVLDNVSHIFNENGLTDAYIYISELFGAYQPGTYSVRLKEVNSNPNFFNYTSSQQITMP